MEEASESSMQQHKSDHSQQSGNSETEVNRLRELGKPQVWIRIPHPVISKQVRNCGVEFFKISEDGKVLEVLAESDERMLRKLKSTDKIGRYFNFECNGILQGVSQENTYNATVNDVIVQGMNGVSGVIICVGPDKAGKGFTLFGSSMEFENRGIIPRALETIFKTTAMRQKDIQYLIRFGIVDVRRNLVRDLLSPDFTELRRTGRQGPLGMTLRQINCIQQGLGLLLLALSAQKLSQQNQYTKRHLIVHFEIYGEYLNESSPKNFRSRVIFVKLASMPKKSESSFPVMAVQNYSSTKQTKSFFKSHYQTVKPNRTVALNALRHVFVKTRTTSNNDDKTCQIENIETRKDLFLVEQMFARSKQLHRLSNLYQKLKRLGVKLSMKRPNTMPSEFIRQNKLANCIQDAVSGKAEVRVFLNIYLEKENLSAILETLRFGERCKCIPHDKMIQDDDEASPENLKHELLLLMEDLKMQDHANASETGDFHAIPSATNQRLAKARKKIYDAAAFLDDKLDEIEIVNKSQVKVMFETFRTMWQYAKESKEKEHSSHEETSETEPHVEIGHEKASETPHKRNSSNKKKKTKSGRRKKEGQRPEKEVKIVEPEEEVGKSAYAVPSTEETLRDAEILGEYLEPASGSISNVNLQNVSDTGNEHGKEELSSGTPTEHPPPIVVSLGNQSERSAAWNEFVASETGHHLNDALTKVSASLVRHKKDQKETLEKLKTAVTKLTQYLEEYDKLQEQRLLKYDPFDVVAALYSSPHEDNKLCDIQSVETNRNDLLEKLKDILHKIDSSETLVEQARRKLDVAFDTFCLEYYGFVYGKDSEGDHQNQEVIYSSDELLPELSFIQENYADIAKFAKAQAYQLILDYSRRNNHWKS